MVHSYRSPRPQCSSQTCAASRACASSRTRRTSESFESLGDGARAHRALVDVEGPGKLAVQNVLAHAKARAHGEDDALGQARLNELDAFPDRVAAPVPHDFEIDALARGSGAAVEHEVGHGEPHSG